MLHFHLFIRSEHFFLTGTLAVVSLSCLSLAPHVFNFSLGRLSTLCLVELLLCFSFPVLWNMFIFFHLHTTGLLHPHSNSSLPSPDAFSHRHCFFWAAGDFLQVVKTVFLSPSGRTLGMMARCTSPRWQQPTWATTPVMPMATRNSFRPILFKCTVRGTYSPHSPLLY